MFVFWFSFFLNIYRSKLSFFFLDRKELELALQEDSEEEEDGVLNLAETDGMLWPVFEN